MSGFYDNKIEFFDLSTERDYVYSTHNLPTPVLLSYLRKICEKTLFLGISVLLENVLDFKQGLSQNAKDSAKKAYERILEIDKNLN